jgi:hypothetical protein
MPPSKQPGKPVVDLANTKYGWRVGVEPEEGEDGKGRAYAKLMFENALTTENKKADAWKELISLGMMGKLKKSSSKA